MATHSSILAQKIPWREDPGRPQFMKSQESYTTQQLNNLNKLGSAEVVFSVIIEVESVNGVIIVLASLVAQTIKNPSAVQETWVHFLGWEDPLEEDMTTHSSIAWRSPMDRDAWRAAVHGVTKSQTQLSD